MGDANYIHDLGKLDKDKFAYVKQWRPAIPNTLLEEQPTLVILMKEMWSADPSDRPDFLSIEPRISELKADPSPSEGKAGEATLLTDKEESGIRQKFQSSPKKYSAFLSHHKVACAAEARLLKKDLDRILGKGSFLGTYKTHSLFRAPCTPPPPHALSPSPFP